MPKKLNEDVVYTIIDLVDSGGEPTKVADQFGLTRQTIHYIVRGERWKEVWDLWVEDHGRRPRVIDWRLEGHGPKKKLTDEDIYEILTLLDEGVPYREIAERFHIRLDHLAQVRMYPKERVLEKWIEDHERSPNKPNLAKKLTDSDVFEILTRAQTESAASLAEEFGVSINQIFVIKRGESRRSIYEKWKRTHSGAVSYLESFLQDSLNPGSQHFADKMDDLRLEKMKASWLQLLLDKFPEPLVREFLAEYKPLTLRVIKFLTSMNLAHPRPITIQLSQLLRNEDNADYLIDLPEEEIRKINSRYGINFQGNSIYNPKRFKRFLEGSKLPGSTAKPSVMINGHIEMGVGRFVSALLRGDKTLRVWDLVWTLRDPESP